jgi:RES domain-containing protein
VRIAHVDRRDTVRLVDSRHDSGTGSGSEASHALAALADDTGRLADLVDLTGLTSSRERAEQGDSPYFGRNLLVSGVPLAAVVNAAFTYPAGSGAGGGRFNDERVGAWYAGHDLATARAEVEHHRRRFLADARIVEATLSFTAYLSDLTADAAVLSARADRRLLDPQSYAQSQAFARQCLDAGIGAVDYPSVRAPAGRCVAILLPSLVQRVRRGRTRSASWAGGRFTWA